MEDKGVKHNEEVRNNTETIGVNILDRLRCDSIYRRKFILTASICLSYVAYGWVVIQIGTALPDLQQLASIDLETASWLFTSWALGLLLGSLVCGVLYDRWNRLAIMLTNTIGCAICTLCFPHTTSFPVMICIRILTGIFCGGIDTGANTIVPTMWGPEGTPYMQALYFSYTLGGIVAPFATRPFMAPKRKILKTTEMSFPHDTADNTSISQNRNILVNNENESVIRNITSTVIPDLNQVTHESVIQFAFLVSGCLVLLSALPYMCMLKSQRFGGNVINYYTKACTKDTKDENVDTNRNHSPQRRGSTSSKGATDQTKSLLQENQINPGNSSKLEGHRKYFILACVAGINFTYSATEDSLGDFLVTFCRNYLDWDNFPSVTLMSLYWVMSCVGGLAGVFLVKLLGTSKLLVVAILLWNMAFLSSWIASIMMIDILIWICVPASGIVMVMVIPTTISWTEKNVCNISGKVSALFMISTGTGITLNPSFVGYMMEEYSYACLFLILFLESFLCCCFYLFASVGKCACQLEDNITENA